MIRHIIRNTVESWADILVGIVSIVTCDGVVSVKACGVIV